MNPNGNQSQSTSGIPPQNASRRTAKKSSGTRQITPLVKNASVDPWSDLNLDFLSTSGIIPPQNASRRTAKKSSGTRQITPLVENASVDPWSDSNLDFLVYKCVSFILVADQKKYAIKKQDIIKNVFEYQDPKLYKTVLEKSCEILKKTFGLEILIIEDRKNEYLPINLIDCVSEIQEFAEYTTLELQKQGLVFYLLTLIYMNGNVINEKELWNCLEPLGIDVDSKVPHVVFGDVKKYITVELVKQMYLEYKCVSKDPPQYEFVWGHRAKQEIGKEDLLEFACKVMDNTKPENWVYQYNDALK